MHCSQPEVFGLLSFKIVMHTDKVAQKSLALAFANAVIDMRTFPFASNYVYPLRRDNLPSAIPTLVN